MGIDPTGLWSIFIKTMNEAAEIWKKSGGLADDRIIRIATDDNFWMMGSTGPWGPCFEIFLAIWRITSGAALTGSPRKTVDRLVEIWEPRIHAYERFEDGKPQGIAERNHRHGMGIERVAALLQGTTTLWRD